MCLASHMSGRGLEIALGGELRWLKSEKRGELRWLKLEKRGR